MLILSIKKCLRSVGWHTPAITIFGSRGERISKEFKVISYLEQFMASVVYMRACLKN